MKKLLILLFLPTILFCQQLGPPPIPMQQGNTTVVTKLQPRIIYLQYAYAPGIATLLKNAKTGVQGQALLYSMIDPWAGSMNIGNNSAFGGNNYNRNGNYNSGNNWNSGMGNFGGGNNWNQGGNNWNQHGNFAMGF
jgi:hypothetical protein